jgi:hypothetical protein
MGFKGSLRVRMRLFIKRWKYRFFEMPKRFDDIVHQFDNLIQEVHSNNTLNIDLRQWIGQMDCHLSEFNHSISNETRLRQAQCKKIKDNVKRLNKRCDDFELDFVEIKDTNKNIIQEMQSFINRHKGLISLSQRFTKALDDLHKLEDISKKGLSDFDIYRKELLKDVEKFKKNDAAVSRLAHLEERITLMEIKQKGNSHNGSGENVSGSIRAN